MKTPTMVTAMLLALLTGIFAMDTEPTSNQLTFDSDFDASFCIRRFNDGRAQPINLVVKGTNVAFSYVFRADGRLTSFRITLDDIFEGFNEELVDERFRVDFNEQTGDISGFIPTEIGMRSPGDPPEPFACDDCEIVRDDVCDSVDNFCDLIEPGLLGNDLIDTALGILCDIIVNFFCSQVSAEDVCSETCLI